MLNPPIRNGRNGWFPLLAGFLLLVTAHLATNAIAADVEWHEFELDQGPQGKQMNRELYGYATLGSDKHIGAGESGTWDLTYTVGKMGIDDGGRIFLLTHITADWGLFQTVDSTGPNFVSARTTGRAKHFVIDVNRRHAGPRPYWTGLEITVREGDLKAGDQVIPITAGDEDGVVLSVDAPASAILTFDGSVNARNQFGEDAGNFRRLSFSIPIGELTQTEAVFLAGGVDRQVAVSKVGKGSPRTVRFAWQETEEHISSGAYGVRVKLEDGATAWSSPIFVER